MTSTPTLGDVIGDVVGFVSHLVVGLQQRYGISVSGMELDHVCFRCDSTQEYLEKRSALAPFGEKIIESMIGGRPISTFLLHTPIIVGDFQISCIELPHPKPGKSHSHGLEHAEFVLGVTEGRPKQSILDFIDKHQLVQFDTRALKKELNPDVSVSVGTSSAKFHERPLYKVVELEVSTGAVEYVPADYFDSSRILSDTGY
eukprot:m.148016 g.148016  ORF g.148016 m.148016 type:complete len:201 (+) comp17787_c0_seq1:284-886(+)